MKTLSITAVSSIIAVIGLSVAPTFASDGEDTINGRSKFAIETALQDMGVSTSRVEEWGGLVRAWVSDGNGGTTMQFFETDSLQPVSPARG